jgi:hypothetical protein
MVHVTSRIRRESLASDVLFVALPKTGARRARMVDSILPLCLTVLDRQTSKRIYSTIKF